MPVGVGATVGDVAEVEEVEAPSTISRSDGERAVTVTGRITSTFLTLLVVPIGYSLLEGARSRRKKRR